MATVAINKHTLYLHRMRSKNTREHVDMYYYVMLDNTVRPDPAQGLFFEKVELL